MYHCRLLISILPECGILCLFWCLRSVLCLQEKKGLRYGAIDLKEMKESKGFKWCVRLFILLLVVYLAGTILSSPIVNAKKYQQLLKVEEGEFTKDIEELSFDQIPLLDKESAQL